MLSSWIPLQQVDNARQLGGLPTMDGRQVKDSVLYRSGELTRASQEDLQSLSEHVQCVVDLRTSFELQHHPDIQVSGTTYVNMPVLDEDNNIWVKMMHFPGENDAERLLNFARCDEAKQMCKHIHIGFVDDEFCQLQYAAFLEMLIHDTHEHVLCHCSQGKDRTGLYCAFLLFSLGCSRETVVQEFALTNIYYHNVVERLKRQLIQQGGTPEDTEVIQTLMGVKVEYFEDALDHIDKQYGGIQHYLRDVLLLTDNDIDTLRSKYLS